MMIDVIGWLSKEPGPMFSTHRLAAREGKKVDAMTTQVLGIMMKRN
jgi:hypothetical protein